MKWLLSGGALFVAGMVFLFAGHSALEFTNTTAFCVSCHSMRDNVYQEYKTSAHFENSTGVNAECADCHVPKELGPKLLRKVMAAKDVWHWMLGTIDTQGKFELHRPRMAQTVWNYMRESDSRECRSCHNSAQMVLDSQGAFASVKHRKMLSGEKTCVDCHQGVTHKLPKSTEPQTVDTTFDYDEEYAEEIHQTCAGCHGEKAEGTIDGEYPRLAGLPKQYIAEQLRDFKHRERVNIPMVPFTSDRELPEEDIQQIAHYINMIELPTRMPPESDTSISSYERLVLSQFVVNIPAFDEGDAKSGEELYKRECEACHGTDGLGRAERLVPRLSGQHSTYLKRQLEQFLEGKRLHDTSEEDREAFVLLGTQAGLDILAYLAQLDDSFVVDSVPPMGD